MDNLIAMNAPSLGKFQKNVAGDGTIYINSDQVSPQNVRSDVKCVAVPVDSLAAELGSPRVANIIMLGAYVQNTGVFKVEEIVKTVCDKLAQKAEFLELNKNAIETGMKYVTGKK